MTKRIAPPFAEARDDHRIFADLADRLGVRAAFTEDLSEMGWLERLYETSRRSSASMGNVMPSFAEFWEAGYFEYPELETGIDSLAAFRDDLPYNAAQIELEEGPRLTANLVGVDNEKISVGMQVEVTFDDVTADVTLLRFQPL